MNEDVPSVGALWAKGAPRKLDDPYHPLICHLVDVACVAGRLWTDALPGSARRWLASQCGLDQAAAGAWVAFCAAVHDIGKASPAFQRRDQFSDPTPHGTISAVVLESMLATAPFALDPSLARRLAVVIGGHHGVFPGPFDVQRAGRASRQIGRGGWAERRLELVDAVGRLFGIAQLPPPKRLTNAGAIWLAGFVSAADWIGSNSDFFPFAAPDGRLPDAFSLDAYAASAREAADRALSVLGWTAWPKDAAPRAFAELFPFEPNDLQRSTVDLARRLTEPALVVVEAPMGEGKTEAALYLADHNNVALAMRGHYIAMPTQATSNQMFNRDRDFLGRRYPAELVNVQLLHGHAAIASDLQALADGERSYLEALDIPLDHNQGFDGAAPGVVAAAWFTARRRGLLAPFGVGTVDQALLAVLQTRHYFVRLLGLAGKTVILDEVHAYDAYMSAILERLLTWLAALGCTVVLLSATLPRARRDALERAFLQGLPDWSEANARLDAPEPPYPSLAWRTATNGGSVPLAVSATSRKSVALHWLPTETDAIADGLGPRLAAALAGGGCAAVICNTVGQAQRTYRDLKRWFDPSELSLFHARFRYDDRALIERETLRRFGKPGTGATRPHRAVIVATQVIEQSLDLDFDLMATELAPIDLIFQRLGRLHRHRRDRPDALVAPLLWLLAPEERDGLPTFSAATLHVYAEHIVLRTWLALRGRETLLVPDDVTTLIEAVYDDERRCPGDASPATKTLWQTSRERLDAERLRQRSIALRHLVLPPYALEEDFLSDPNNQLEEDDPRLHASLQALTRLGERSVTTICLTPGERESLRPRAGDAPARAASLLRRSVSLTDRRVVHALAEMEPPASWKRTGLLRHCRLVELDEVGGVDVGRWRLQVDAEFGVRVIGEGEE